MEKDKNIKDTMLSLNDLYIYWFNNYISVSLFAEHQGISESLAEKLLDIGRDMNYNHLTKINERRKQLEEQ